MVLIEPRDFNGPFFAKADVTETAIEMQWITVMMNSISY
jgi:hypothetical protein